jgi:hypothetical protein
MAGVRRRDFWVVNGKKDEEEESVHLEEDEGAQPMACQSPISSEA